MLLTLGLTAAVFAALATNAAAQVRPLPIVTGAPVGNAWRRRFHAPGGRCGRRRRPRRAGPAYRRLFRAAHGDERRTDAEGPRAWRPGRPGPSHPLQAGRGAARDQRRGLRHRRLRRRCGGQRRPDGRPLLRRVQPVADAVGTPRAAEIGNDRRRPRRRPAKVRLARASAGLGAPLPVRRLHRTDDRLDGAAQAQRAAMASDRRSGLAAADRQVSPAHPGGRLAHSRRSGGRGRHQSQDPASHGSMAGSTPRPR